MSRCFYLSGGLAVEELGELAAWRPCRRHPDAEETPAEHAHLNPCSAQKHEVETTCSAGMTAALAPHRRVGPCLCLCDHVICVICKCVYLCALTFHVKNTPDFTDS